MNYYSTNRKAQAVSLREAMLAGLAPDGGLYMPEHISKMPADFFARLPSLSFPEIAIDVGRVLFDGDLPVDVLERICFESFDFPIPLVPLEEQTFVLELFHGPTLAFKDFAARFMARLMGYYVRNDDHELTILVATSGDTGSAVAHGFYNVPGIRVFILYPSGRVSDLQEKQLTTMGGNITALEVQGSFDDCQALVKQAFCDPDLLGLDSSLPAYRRQARNDKEALRLGSANSINIARLFPQTFYYFWGVGKLDSRLRGNDRGERGNDKRIAISVPSGNVGNLTAGLIAKKMGLPVSRFIAACNTNTVLPEYLRTGVFTPQASRATISNAMDVGNPSNFARILELYSHSVDALRQDVSAYSFSDDQTRDAIRSVHQETGYVMDPHGALGYCALREYQKMVSGTISEKMEPDTIFTGIFFETAHPAKFKDSVEETIGVPVDIPERLAEYMKREKQTTVLPKTFDSLKEFLLNS